MFDINSVNKRYWDIKLNVTIEKIVDDKEIEEDVELNLQVEPPKLKALKKITSLSKVRDEDAIEDLSEAVRMILNKNKNKTKVSDEVMNELDLDQLSAILTSYFEWLGKEKISKN
ncbi:hypothetical protein [Clostridium sp.]|uniref:hypothetical protein n=1 Tax=Clostridium sp. TaxID=1506 RepID=UPI001A495B27|nr:hypothetical protein [Clostridium sp.]MBK5235705.1 hypothetical protein [Clostridium sp.]